MQAFWGMIATGRAGSFVTRLRRADGVYRWFEVRNLPLRNSDGEIVRWYGVLTDIDDRKHAEDAVAASERDLRLTLETIPAGIIIVSPETGIIGANNQLLGYLGYSLEILKQWTTSNMVHPDDFDSTLTYFRSIHDVWAVKVSMRLAFDGSMASIAGFRCETIRYATPTVVSFAGMGCSLTSTIKSRQSKRCAKVKASFGLS